MECPYFFNRRVETNLGGHAKNVEYFKGCDLGLDTGLFVCNGVLSYDMELKLYSCPISKTIFGCLGDVREMYDNRFKTRKLLEDLK